MGLCFGKKVAIHNDFDNEKNFASLSEYINYFLLEKN